MFFPAQVNLVQSPLNRIIRVVIVFYDIFYGQKVNIIDKNSFVEAYCPFSLARYAMRQSLLYTLTGECIIEITCKMRYSEATL